MALFKGLANAPAHVKMEAFFGIDAELQRQIGTFVVLCSMLEMQIETLAWFLAGKPLAPEPVWTDKLQISDLIKEASKLSEKIVDSGVRAMAIESMTAANDLFAVRHTVVHGRPFFISAEGGPKLLRNASWFGEVRRREQTSISLNSDTLNEGISLADSLHSVVPQIARVFDTPGMPRHALEKADVRRLPALTPDQTGTIAVDDMQTIDGGQDGPTSIGTDAGS